MTTAGKAPRPASRFSVPLAALEADAHVEQSDMVEEVPDSPVPYVYDENVAQLNRVIGAGG